MHCSRCQHDNSTSHTYCSKCGTPLKRSPASRSYAELERDLTEALEQQTATSEILRVISISPTDLQPVFNSILRSAVHVSLDFLAQSTLGRIVDLAAKHHLPTIYSTRDFADAGGLMACGVSRLEMYRHAATYVDKIFKSAKPGDLPIEQSTKFELVINLRTATALGLTIPQSLLQRADQVIE